MISSSFFHPLAGSISNSEYSQLSIVSTWKESGGLNNIPSPERSVSWTRGRKSELVVEYWKSARPSVHRISFCNNWWSEKCIPRNLCVWLIRPTTNTS